MALSRLEPTEILRKLNHKFSSNLESAIASPLATLSNIEIKTQVLGEFGVFLQKVDSKTPTQSQLAMVAEEVFADVVSSMYLASIGLVMPAHMSMRRALELGVALVYLWDLPHVFWGWKECDKDLSFSEMLEYLESKSYRSFLANTINFPLDATLVDIRRLREIYRITSNTTHGKIATHKVLMGDGFSHSATEWSDCLDLLDGTTSAVIQLWFHRYPSAAQNVKDAVPAYGRICDIE